MPTLVAGGVYPRVCGGTGAVSALPGAVVGLSPRVRGNPPGVRCMMPFTGSIPACAGEPLGRHTCLRHARVYPRVCGGTNTVAECWQAGVGLSPRVRGNRRGSSDVCLVTGSIPACAGEPPPHQPRPPACRVYPRVCGGTELILMRSLSVSGLSPRVRGNRRRHLPDLRKRGSIPACAGEPPVTVSWPVV